MPIDTSLVGRTTDPVRVSWSSKDALLYALGVGAGQLDPLQELEFTTENTIDTPQRVLPTFVNVVAGGGVIRLLPPDVDSAKTLHASQAFTLHRPLDAEGRLDSISKIVGVYDKGSGALIEVESTARDAVGEVVATLQMAMFVLGAGGFGGDRGPAPQWQAPTGAPDHVVTYSTRPDQALLYRLTGDRNPLHSDPAAARRGGFDVPILHGMCTYGYTGRALLHAVAGSNPARFTGMSGRFTKPILPGESITVSIWIDGSDVRYTTTNEFGDVVIDRGTATIN